jgi:CheY-like chemotaxis protein
MSEGEGSRVLVVDNDRDIADVVSTILLEAGYRVEVLNAVDSALLRVRVFDFAPDCVLLDGQGPGVYGESWENAAWLHTVAPHIATIMFTADQPAADEARSCNSPRSREAQFTVVLSKPFDLDELTDAVENAIKSRALA